MVLSGPTFGEMAAANTARRERTELARKSGEQEPPFVAPLSKKRKFEEPEPEPEPLEEANLTPWCNDLKIDPDWLLKESVLHREIIACTSFLLPTPYERQARELLINHIKALAKARWPDATVSVFGGYATNLSSTGGDIDMTITFPNPLDEDGKRTLLYRLASILRDDKLTPWVQVISKARVPIVKFTTTEDLGSISVDISVDALDGVKAVPIVNSYLDQMPALRHLVLLLKSFLGRRNLNSAATNSLSSYGVICMCISFLQLNPKKRDEKWITEPLESESLGTLLMDFFQYYSDEFLYETACISATQGKLLTKDEKGFLRRDEGLLSIECLVNPGNDVTRGAGKIRRIREAFKEGYEILNNAEVLDPYSSMLTDIAGVPQSVLDHRQKLHRRVKFDSMAGLLKQSGTKQQLPIHRPLPDTRPHQHRGPITFNRQPSHHNGHFQREVTQHPRNYFPRNQPQHNGYRGGHSHDPPLPPPGPWNGGRGKETKRWKPNDHHAAGLPPKPAVLP